MEDNLLSVEAILAEEEWIFNENNLVSFGSGGLLAEQLVRINKKRSHADIPLVQA